MLCTLSAPQKDGHEGEGGGMVEGCQIRRSGLALVLAVGVAMAAMLALLQAPASSATQQERPDASCQGTQNSLGIVSGSGVIAQTFTAQNTGRLTSVEVPVQDNGGDVGNLVMEIRTTDASGVPTDTVLASTSVPASQIGPTFETVRGSFDPRAEVVAGEQYALSLRATEGGNFTWAASDLNPCPGQGYGSPDGGQSFTYSYPSHDFFSAFVTPPPPEPPAPKPACNDGRDNDRDGRTDLRDPGCENRRDDSERNRAPESNSDNDTCTITGNNRDNTIRGTDRRDVICAPPTSPTITAVAAVRDLPSRRSFSHLS